MRIHISLLPGITAVLLGSVSSLLLAASVLTQPVQQAEQAALFPSTDMIELGRTVAGTACANCHGMDGMKSGEGQPYLAGQRAVYLYRVLLAYHEGDREDDSMQKVSRFLNDEAMLSVAAYYASLTPARKADTTAQGQEPGVLGDDPFSGIRQAIGKCVKCHGETGNSTASGMSNLTGQDPEYFVTSMHAYIDGSRKHRLMKKFAGALDEPTIRQMGVFYAVQEPAGTQTQGDGDVETGRQLAAECGVCHGADGNAGGSITPTLAGQDARYFVKAMKAYKGSKREHDAMLKAVEGLSEQDFVNLATFYAVQKPVQRNVRTPLKTSQWIARCERCHGANGNSTDPRFPMLAGQNEDYLRTVMQAYLNETRTRTVMHAMTEPLSTADVERIVTYYAAQDPKSVVYIELPCQETVEE